MNILLINHYAGGPAWGMEYRPFYLAREWVRAGHQVQIVAGAYSHVRARQPEVGGEPLDSVQEGVNYRFYPTPAYQGNGLGRVKNIAHFLAGVWRERAHWQAWQPDVVIASSTYPMDIWLARHLARRSGAKLVFEVHDLWPLSPIELSGMSPHHPFAMLCQKAENDAYRDADVVVSMLPKVHGHMQSHGLDLRKLHIVPNGITTEEWAPAAAQPLPGSLQAHLEALRAQGQLVVGYAGSMGEPNALDVLLDAARGLLGQPLSVVLVGDGHEGVRLRSRVSAEGLTNVRFFEPIPKAAIPTFLRQLDVAYIGWQRTPIYRFGIAPNKLMDYMMAGCAVLHSVEAGNDPVAESGCGLTVPPQDAAVVAEGLLKLAALSPAQRREMGERGQAFVLAHHTYPVLAQRFLNALNPLSVPTKAQPNATSHTTHER